MGGGMMRCAPTEGGASPVLWHWRSGLLQLLEPREFKVQNSKFNLRGAKSRKAGVQKDGADCQPS